MLRKIVGAALALGCVFASVPASAQQVTKQQAGGVTRTLPLYPLSPMEKARINGALAGDVGTSIAGLSGPKSATVRPTMSPVRDQGSRGTCSAHATLGLFERNSKADLSEQCLASKATPGPGGQNPEIDGAWIHDLVAYSQANGLNKETECPYKPNNIDRNVIPAGLASSVSVPKATLLKRPNLGSLSEIRSHIAAGRAVAISIYVTTNTFFQDADTVINVPATGAALCSSTTLCAGHSVVVVGYDDATRTLTFKNSWGSSWKNGGYGRMTYEYFLESYMENGTPVAL